MELGISSVVTIESVRQALGAAAMRQQAIASNIANINSADHIRMKVVFEEQMQGALASARSASSAEEAMALLRTGAPAMVADTVTGKAGLDEEMTALSANATRYHALTKGLSRYLSIASLVVSATRG